MIKPSPTSALSSLLLAAVLLAASCDDSTSPDESNADGDATAETTGDGAAKAKAKAKAAEDAPPKDVPVPADVAAAPADATVTASGLAYKKINEKPCEDRPTADATVKVHYTGWTTDGEQFDSSVTKGRAASFPLGRVISGWTEGLQLMCPGEDFRFWIPQDLAYQGKPGAPAGMLVFDVNLIEFKNPPEPLPAPPDVAAPPKDAKTTDSGLAYKVLQAGTGTAKPTATDKVKVHYSGWTTDGEMFDSSVVRGEPASFPLNRVIAGWTEGLQLMVVGEKTRFWIPVELAYKGRPGRPAGMLVFDVELIEIADK